jgi:acetyl-CoA acetyltransferase
VDDHQQSRMIVHPYHIMDCCQETDVACALIVTTAERARDLKKQRVLISGAVSGSGSLARTYPQENFDTEMIQNTPRLLAAADVALKDVDFAELYDQFTGNPFYLTEDIGWCKRGEAKDFFGDGHMELDGDVPMQTHGGLMNEGYAHGLNHPLEAVQQLRGEAEDLCPNWQAGEHTFDRKLCRQVRNAEIGLSVASMGNSALVLRKG